MRGNRGPPFPGFVQKHSDSEQPWTAFSMKMGKHEEPKDKQISCPCISFTAIYMFMEMKTSWNIGTDHIIIAESISVHK